MSPRALGVRYAPRCTRCGNASRLHLYRSTRVVFPVRVDGSLGEAVHEVTGSCDEIACPCGHSWRSRSYRGSGEDT